MPQSSLSTVAVSSGDNGDESNERARYATLQGIKIVPRGFIIPKLPTQNRWFVQRALQQLTFSRSENRFASKFAPKPPPLRVFLDGRENLVVPKFWGIGALKGKGATICNANRDGVPIDVTYRADMPLVEEKRRPQQSAFAFAMHHIGRTGGAMMVMPVGTGKTNVGLRVFAECGVKTLWLVHRKNLMEQCAERAAEFVPGVRVGWMFADTLDIDDKDLVLGTVQSLGQKTYDPTIFEQFGLIILDEAHHAAAPVFVDALFTVAAPRMLALTANPQRKDGLTQIIHHFFSENAFVVEPTLPDGIVLHARIYRLFQRSQVLEHDLCDARFKKKERAALLAVKKKHGCSEAQAVELLRDERERTPDDVGDNGYSALCSGLGRIAPRNALLVALIKKALVTPDAEQFGDVTRDEMRDVAFAQLHDRDRSTVLVRLADDDTCAPIDSLPTDRVRRHMRQCERQVIVASMHKALVDSLKKRLVRSGLPAHMIGTYYGDAPAAERLCALQKRVVIVTYAMAEEGLDVPTANTLIMAAPRGDSVEQTIGRVLRDKMTANIQPIIVDLVDTWCGMAEGMYWKRHRQYKRYPSRFRMFDVGVPRSIAKALTDTTDERIDEPGAASQAGEHAGKKRRAAESSMSAAERSERKETRKRVKRARQQAHITHSVQSAANTVAATTQMSDGDDAVDTQKSVE